MSDVDWLVAAGMGFIMGIFTISIFLPPYNVNAEKVATQICEFLDTDLIDYDWGYGKFDYIKCGDKKLIEGLDAETLIEILD